MKEVIKVRRLENGSIIGMNEIFVSGGNDSIIGTGLIGCTFINK